MPHIRPRNGAPDPARQLRLVSPPARGVPGQLGRVIGRGGVVAGLAQRLATANGQLVTILGPAGMGKTTIAVSLARDHARAYRDGVCVVDLAPLGQPALVPGAVASALGVPLPAEDPVGGLAAMLGQRHLLLVLDNCEHVIAATAAICSALRERAPTVQILATSRQALAIPGEIVHELAPLAAPPRSRPLSARLAMGYAAVELFVERAVASAGGFVLADDDVPVVAELCRRLDGIPLAIELAAARVNVLGLQGLASELAGPGGLLLKGRRTAPLRQLTLAATLDWSYRTLTADEQCLLRRLALFQNAFSVEAAVAVVSDAELPATNVPGLLAALVDRSLVSQEVGGHDRRLLEMTRAYALDKLIASGDRAALRRRHATYLRDLLRVAERDWPCLTRGEWIGRYGRCIDDVRAALTWALDEVDGDVRLGAELAVVAAPLGWQLCLQTEFRGHVSRSLAALAAQDLATPALDMTLNLALSVLHQQGSIDSKGSPDFDRPRLAALRGHELAVQLGDVHHRQRALEFLSADAFTAGDYPSALDWAQQHGELARPSSDPVAAANTDRLMAMALHHLGEQQRARHHAERVLEQLSERADAGRNHPSNIDWRISMRILLARISWLQGHSQRAAELVDESLELAWAAGHAIAVAYALGYAACPIALWRGDDSLARQRTETLLRCAEQHALPYWRSWARCFAVYLSTGDGAARRTGLRECGFSTKQLDHLATLHGDLVAPETVARVERGQVGWCAPEVLRRQGERALQARVAGGRASAESLFRAAIQLARRQGSLAWELRASHSLARLLTASGEARDLR